MCCSQGQLAEALPFSRQALAIQKSNAGDLDPGTVAYAVRLWNILASLGGHEQELQQLTQAHHLRGWA